MNLLVNEKKAPKASYQEPLPTLAVVIPFHQDNQVFRSCLDSVIAASDSVDEIILVNDGPDNILIPFQEDLLVTVIKTKGARGPAFARNQGVQKAHSDIICFIDSDVTVPVHLFNKIKEIFYENTDLTALFGSYDDKPGDDGFLSQYRNLLHHYVHQNSNEKASTFWTGCGAIKRSAFLAFSGFDEDLYQSPEIEDIEFGYRLKEAGCEIRLVKDLQVKHLKQWTANSLVKADLFYRAIPWTKLILQQKGLFNDLNLKIHDRISVVLVYSALLFLPAGFWNTNFLNLSLVCTLLFYLTHIPLYKFFFQRKGLLFLVRVLPWHWMFYFLAGLGFSIGVLKHFHLFFQELKWGIK